jgi:hypothetical protein
MFRREFAMGKAPTRIANPVYDPNSPHHPNPPSKYIYFYYLKEVSPKVRAYRIEKQNPVSDTEIEALVKDVATRIKNGTYPDQPDGFTLGRLTWKKKSYIAIVLEDNQQKLINGNAVTFELELEDGSLDGNHTFRDGHDIPLFDNNITGFYCFNYMRGVHGNDLGNREAERFWVEVHHNRSGMRAGAGPRSHDDAGTNLGPP